MRTPDSIPVPRARTGIHERVQSLLDTLGPGAGKSALDAPLGPGAMALHLCDIGYSVSGVDINLEQSACLPARITRRAGDLCARLPFADASFDLITSLEGIEHVENHFSMVREFGRVIKPGGHLILSTPNICNLEERLNFLFRGAAGHFISRAEMEQHGAGYDHQNLISYVELRQVLDWAGFQLERVEKDAPKRRQALFLWPLWLVLHLYVKVQSAKRKSKYLLEETSSGNVLFGGNTIILQARKV